MVSAAPSKPPSVRKRVTGAEHTPVMLFRLKIPSLENLSPINSRQPGTFSPNWAEWLSCSPRLLWLDCRGHPDPGRPWLNGWQTPPGKEPGSPGCSLQCGHNQKGVELSPVFSKPARCERNRSRKASYCDQESDSRHESRETGLYGPEFEDNPTGTGFCSVRNSYHKQGVECVHLGWCFLFCWRVFSVGGVLFVRRILSVEVFFVFSGACQFFLDTRNW